MTQSFECCGACRFFERETHAFAKAESKAGHCVRYPPVVLRSQGAGSNGLPGEHPKVHDSAWCGEFQRGRYRPDFRMSAGIHAANPSRG